MNEAYYFICTTCPDDGRMVGFLTVTAAMAHEMTFHAEGTATFRLGH